MSLWARNLQLAFYSVLTACVPLYMSGDLDAVYERGFFYGYTSMTWCGVRGSARGGSERPPRPSSGLSHRSAEPHPTCLRRCPGHAF